MAASTVRCVNHISSKFTVYSPYLIRISSPNNCGASLRVQGTRFCSNFKSKSAIYDGQEETENVNKIEQHQLQECQEQQQEETPKWKLTRQFFSKRYAMEGKASGVDPSIMWPTRSELENIIKDEEEWNPSLQQMQSEIAEEQHAKDQKRKKREALIAANMKKMPQMVEEYYKKQAQKQVVLDEQTAKRNRLLEEAKDKLGYAIDPRSSRFQRMVQEIEKEEKKKKKELKRKGISM